MSDEIFFSYANEDEARVEPLVRLLEAAGWSVWWDREIPVGRTFDEVIEEALDAARCVIVVWTEKSVASRWVKTEAAEGVARQVLVPVLMDDVRIPLAFRRIQAADLVGWEGEQQHPGVEQLVDAISRVAGSPKRAAPEPEQENEPPLTVAIEPEPEAQAGAIHDDSASEEEAVREYLEEQTVAPPEAPPEEELAPPEKRVPAGLERWIKEPNRLVLVAAVAALVVIALVVVSAIQNGDSSDDSPQPGVASIEIKPSEATIMVDSTVQLTVILKEALENLLDESVVWESSDPSIASVDSTGVVTGLKEGSAIITAKSEAAQGTTRVGVSPAPLTESQPQRVPDIDFVLISAGTFQMGSTNGYDDEQPVHTVRLSSFSMSATEVTQGQWKAVMGNNPSYFTGDDDLPVENVSWDDVQTFISRLNTLQGCRGCYRLPTEAEWEYAARAGTTGDYAGDLESMEWYYANSGGKTHPVRQKRRNAWDLYDMYGNVREWVADWYDSEYYRNSPETDPKGPETGSFRVFRGGSFSLTAGYARSAFRDDGAPGTRYFNLGFRLLRMAL